MEKETVKSETKKEGATSLKDLEKQMRFVTFLILMGVAWIKWLRYIVLWCTVALGIWWITLPVFFFWTTDYWYLKMFGTIPFIGFACMFLLFGLNETFKYSSKKENNATDEFKEAMNLSEELMKHEQVMRNNIETTMAILAATDKLMSSIEQIKNKNSNGKQNDITTEPKN